MKTQSINWNLSGLAGHDENGNEISVRHLVERIEYYQSIAEIASMSESMRDALAMRAAENYIIKTQNDQHQRTIRDLESALNNAHLTIERLLIDQALPI